jgi:lipopolysaccharide transport system permease protein
VLRAWLADSYKSMLGRQSTIALEIPAKPKRVIEPRVMPWQLNLTELWQYRELLYFLVWRDVKIRYKQTAIGVAWAILQPLAAMLIFALVFGHFIKVPSKDLPYPLFAYAGLLAWTYFSQATLRSGASVVGERALITKVYFPRLIIPLASVVSPLVDFFWSLFVVLGLVLWYGIDLRPELFMLPVFLMLALFYALAVGLWLAALNVRYRDVGHAIPLLLQIWMFASPIIYPVTLVPEQWRFAYSLNPVVSVIEGFRWGFSGNDPPAWSLTVLNILIMAALFVGGLGFFKKMEQTFTDEI